MKRLSFIDIAGGIIIGVITAAIILLFAYSSFTDKPMIAHFGF